MRWGGKGKFILHETDILIKFVWAGTFHNICLQGNKHISIYSNDMYYRDLKATEMALTEKNSARGSLPLKKCIEKIYY